MWSNLSSKGNVLLIGTMGLVTLMIAFSSYSVVAESLIVDLGLSYFQSGLLMSSFALAYALMQIPSGVASDRYGGRKVLLTALFVLGSSSLMFYFLNSFEAALITRVLMGASSGLILPASVKLIASEYEPQELEKAMGILGLGQGMGLTISYISIPTIMTTFNYRGGTLLAASFSLIVAVLGLFGLKEPLKKELANADSKNQTLFDYGSRKILNRKMLFLILINLSGSASLFGVLAWAPIYLSRILKGPFIYVGFVTGIAGLTNLIGSYSGTLSARILGSKTTITISMMLCAILPSAIPFVDQTIGIIIIIASLGWFTMLYFSPVWALVPSSVDEDLKGGAFGFFNTLSFLGAFFAPLAVGQILDITGSYTIGFVTISLIAVPGLAASLLLKAK
jgi:MFS family permease